MKIKLPSLNIEVKPVQLDSVSDFLIKIAIICIPFGTWKIVELFILMEKHFNLSQALIK